MVRGVSWVVVRVLLVLVLVLALLLCCGKAQGEDQGGRAKGKYASRSRSL